MFVDNTWLDIAIRSFVLASVGLAWVTLLIRMVGLRSLSKMTNFDFIMTVALGSVLASGAMATEWTTVGQAMLVAAGLFGTQVVASRLRRVSDTVQDVLDNQAVFLMRNGEFCEAALKETRVSKADVIGKLREANCLTLDAARAVVLESTGDVSVLHGDDVDERLLEGVATI